MKNKQLTLFEQEQPKQQRKKVVAMKDRRQNGKANGRLINGILAVANRRVAMALIVLSAFAAQLQAQRVHVRGHFSPKRGTYVMPHYRTAPDHSRLNNWSSRGNVNPYTGKRGTTDPYRLHARRY